MVPTRSSGPVPHRNAMPNTGHDIQPRVNRQRADPSLCYPSSHCNTQLPILMPWVRPDQEILPPPSTHTPANPQLYYAVCGGIQSEAQ